MPWRVHFLYRGRRVEEQNVDAPTALGALSRAVARTVQAHDIALTVYTNRRRGTWQAVESPAAEPAVSHPVRALTSDDSFVNWPAMEW